jgi:hypothetical protein
MAKKGGKRGGSGNFAARSAAAKKGWETRRRGGAKAKPAATKPTAASKPKTTPKTTTARGRARTAETRARAAVKAGGGTRATRSLLTAQRARDYYKATGTGTKRSRSRPRFAGPASSIRRTGGLQRPGPRNNVRQFKPTSPAGAASQADRRLVRSVEKTVDAIKGLRPISSRLRKMKRENTRSFARFQARALADRLKGGIDAELAGITLRNLGSRLGRMQIQHRARRAARKAAAGSAPAARALELYRRQLAPTLPKGKIKRRTGNNIVPGPRNTTGPAKPKRKPRKPRKPKG